MTNEQSKTLSVREAADMLGIGQTCCYEQIRTGKIPSLKFGKSIRISRAALDAMLGGERPVQLRQAQFDPIQIERTAIQAQINALQARLDALNSLEGHYGDQQI